jgi:hypothetical protein
MVKLTKAKPIIVKLTMVKLFIIFKLFMVKLEGHVEVPRWD